MISSSEPGFFSFFLGDILQEVANVVVTVPDGTWPLSDSLVLRLETRGLVQVIVDVSGQEIVELRDEHDVQVRGDYEDLIARRIEPVALPDVALPAEVTSLVEFRADDGQVIRAEIQTTVGAFSVLLYPEDVEVRPCGAVWDFVREHGLPQLGQVTVVQLVGAAAQPEAEPPASRGA